MAWRENEARERLIDATLTFKDIHGPERLIDFLEQELHREIVVRNHHEARRALAAATSAAELATEKLRTAVKALEFYADISAHESRNGKPSRIAKDQGRRARDAIEAISGEPGGGDDGQDDDESGED